MKKIDILFVDWGLSRSEIENTLSDIINLELLNFSISIRKELQSNSELSKEIRAELDSGELMSNQAIAKLITQNITENNSSFLFSAYPNNMKQFKELQKILVKENVTLNKVWFFKLKNPKDFMEKHYENPLNNEYLKKYGNEVIENWETKFDERRKNIDAIRNVMDSVEWKIIEMDYVMDLSAEYIIKRIKDCA